jgi:hypothetical protein
MQWEGKCWIQEVVVQYLSVFYEKSLGIRMRECSYSSDYDLGLCFTIELSMWMNGFAIKLLLEVLGGYHSLGQIEPHLQLFYGCEYHASIFLFRHD